MAFVNEFVSEGDLRKYPVKEIWLRYHRRSRPLPDDFRFNWTIDREREVFLMCVEIGTEEWSNRFTFVLSWLEEEFECVLEKHGKGNLIGAVTTIWRLISLSMPAHSRRTRAEVIELIKEAVSAYKVLGLGIEVADHTAIFEF